ncbi:MAG: hypothetical protein M3068_06635 [Gemmatimonadota bacterium]|nr:hypothetical protein [Gemmatimonadota bacterium]
MERLVPQLYGYTVCLVTLIWALASAVSLIDNTAYYTAPELRTGSRAGLDEPSVSSFEAFRATYDRSRRFGPPDAQRALADTLSEPVLRRRYEALRADHVHRVRFESAREIVKSILSLIITAAIFVWHWRWLRRRVVAPAA